jgi:hypothetical protein
VPASFATFPRNAAIAAVFNTPIAAALGASGPYGFVPSLVYSQCIGFVIFLCIDVPRRLLWPPAARPPLWGIIGLTAVGLGVGLALGSLVAARILGLPPGAGLLGPDLARTLVITLFAGIAVTWYFVSRERLANVERGAAEARLKLLQAQIEPHFLFNTLANLDSLIGADPARARKMLGHLNDYLRATLQGARGNSATLAEEFTRLKGYLEILAIRMGPRLAFSLSLPEELAGLRVPPMLLQPLVENAVKHGLEPKIEGGRIDISAFRENDLLVVKISDTGLGYISAESNGVGLANIRDRLAATYAGGRACLTIEHNEAKGVTATVAIPA